MRGSVYIVLVIFCLPIQAQIYFADEAANIGFTDHCGSVSLGNGLSFVDYDNDGYDDITLTSGDGVPLRFYKNFQGLFFEELLINPAITYQTKAVTWVDYDNDGDKDLYVTSNVAGNRLFQKTDSGLVDVTVSSGLPFVNINTYGASWGDVNNDGCLDVYISNRIAGSTTVTNYLFRSNCDGTFTNATDLIGLSNTPALTFCSGFLDFNNDGWQDIYVANDKFFPNYLFKNNGDGTFTDVSATSGTDIIVDAMSVTVDDFNSDGYLDIYVTNTPNEISTPSQGNVLLKNNGDETFTNISVTAGTVFESFAWGSTFFDAENDGDLDLYVSSSYDGSFNGYPSATFYENQGNETFTEPNSVGFMNDNKMSYSNAIGDLNNDGKSDIIVLNSNDEPPFIWNNQTTSNNNYLSITLEGTQSNKDGVGSLIEISVNGNKQYRYVMCGEGYIAQNSFKEIFGVGTETIIDYVKVKWLSGVEDMLYDVPVNQDINIIEASTLSINDLSSVNVLKLFPNPVNGILKLKSSDIINRVDIYNTLGKIILTSFENLENVEMNLKDLTTGFYYIKVSTDKGSKTKRFIKF
ncbi:FG-GAP-like repeat-containing protein [Winogradskyella sp.]|uniref:FG-GAP-like repeat-containing protein n=1 Tax=Winogradskyella sp. TaxID=1883156 RepID=UPI003F6BE9F6